MIFLNIHLYSDFIHYICRQINTKLMRPTHTRQQAILEIIGQEAVFSQDELLEKLSLRGISATQATLSRDLKALNIQKIPGEGYVCKKPQPVRSSIPTSLAGSIVSIEFSLPLAVIKTPVGFAPALASYLDRHISAPIMGTIAGDDAVFLAIRAGYTQHQTLDVLEHILPGIRARLEPIED